MNGAAINALPDPDLLEQAALGLVVGAPSDWVAVSLVMFYEAEDVYEVRAWTTSAGVGRVRVSPPRVFLQLAKMRASQVAAGQEPWQRCDLEVTRSAPGAEAQMSVDFAYEVGDVPE